MLKSTVCLNRLTYALLLSALILGLGPSLTFRASAEGQEGREKAVRETLLKSALSFEKNDRMMASQVWANDESLTVFEQGHANYGWADYRDNHLFPEMAEIKNTKYLLTDIQVHLAGKTAWATMKYSISGDVTENGKVRHFDGSGLATAVLEERRGRWQIVHWHSSAPRRAPAPAASQ